MNVAQSVVHRDPKIQGGVPVFRGTRVPIWNLIDYLEAGDSLEAFLHDFPSVSPEQAVAALEGGRRGPWGNLRVLLDESLPRRLAAELGGPDVATVQSLGWSSMRNGELLRRAASEGIRVFVTADQGIEFQQNL